MWTARRSLHEDEPPSHATAPTLGVAQVSHSSPTPPRPVNKWGPPPTNVVMTEGFVASSTAHARGGLPPVLPRRFGPNTPSQATQTQPSTHNISTSAAPPPRQPHPSLAPWQPKPPVQEQPEVEQYVDEDVDDDGGALTTTINLMTSAASALFQMGTAALPSPKPPSTQPAHEATHQSLQPASPAVLSPTTSMLDAHPEERNIGQQFTGSTEAIEPGMTTLHKTLTPTNAQTPILVKTTQTNSIPAPNSSSSLVSTPRRQLPTPQPPSTHHRSFLQRPPPAIRASPRNHAKPKFKLPPPVPQAAFGTKKGTSPSSTESPLPVTPSLIKTTMVPPSAESSNHTTSTTLDHVTKENDGSTVGAAMKSDIDQEQFLTVTESTPEVPGGQTLHRRGAAPLEMPSAPAHLTTSLAARPKPPIPFVPHSPAIVTQPRPPQADKTFAPAPAESVPEEASAPLETSPALPPALFSTQPTAPPRGIAPPRDAYTSEGPNPPIVGQTPTFAPPAGPRPPVAPLPTPAPPVAPAAGPKPPVPSGPTPPSSTTPPNEPRAGLVPTFAPPTITSASVPTPPIAPHPGTTPPTAPLGPTPPFLLPPGPSPTVVGPTVPSPSYAPPTKAAPPVAQLSRPLPPIAPSLVPKMPSALPIAESGETTPELSNVSLPDPLHAEKELPSLPSIGPSGPPAVTSTHSSGSNASVQIKPQLVPLPRHLAAPAPPLPPGPAPATPIFPTQLPEQITPSNINGDVAFLKHPPQPPLGTTNQGLDSLAAAQTDFSSVCFDSLPTKVLPSRQLAGDSSQEHPEPEIDKQPVLEFTRESLSTGNVVPIAQPPEREVPNDEASHGKIEGEEELQLENNEGVGTENWVEEWDADSGRPYYYNLQTHETTWEKPGSRFYQSEAEPKAQDRPGDENNSWLSSVDNDDDHHREQGEEQSATPESTLLTATKAAEETTPNGNLSLLPDEWVEVFDEATGQPYFYNLVSQETTWDRPFFEQVVFSGDNSPAVNENEEIAHPEAESEVTSVKHKSPDVPESTTDDHEEANQDFFVQEGSDSVGEAQDVRTQDEVSDGDKCNGLLATDGDENSNVDDERRILPGTSRDSQDTQNLPPGWSEMKDPQSGLPYYYNEETLETTWERPTQTSHTERAYAESNTVASNSDTGVTKIEDSIGASQVDAVTEHDSRKDSSQELTELPEGWVEEFDPTNSRPYYVNTFTNEATWERPALLPETDNSNLENGDKNVDDNPAVNETDPVMELDSKKSSNQEATELPEGWEEKIDQTNGSHYYVNTFTNEATWDRPIPHADAVEQHDRSFANTGHEKMDSDGESNLPTGAISETDPLKVAPEDHFDSDMEPLSVSTIDGVPFTSSTRIKEIDDPGNNDESNLEPLTEVPEDCDSVINSETKLEGSAAPIMDNDDPASAETRNKTEGLAKGWTKHIDPGSGLPFYFNFDQNITTWELPVSNIQETSDEADKEHALEETAHAEGTFISEDEAKLIKEELEHDLVTLPGQEEDIDASQLIESCHAADGHELPEGWVELEDETSGLKYYFNELDNLSTWERPKMVESERIPSIETNGTPQGPLPEEETYMEHVVAECDSGGSKTEGEVNDNTMNLIDVETEKNEDGAEDGSSPSGPQHPALEAEKATNANDCSEATDSCEKVESLGRLPTGWVELTDPDSGMKYYFFEPDGTSSWERPVLLDGGDGVYSEPVQSDEPFTNPEILEFDDSKQLTQENSLAPEEDLIKAAVLQQDTESLPIGWVELIDPDSGKPYYYNEGENVASWERPRAVPEGEAELPICARERNDSMPVATPDVHAEGESTLDKKEAFEAPADNLEASHEGLAESESNDKSIKQERKCVNEKPDSTFESCELPPGWEVLTDEATGTSYYFNNATNESTWVKPTKNSNLVLNESEIDGSGYQRSQDRDEAGYDQHTEKLVTVNSEEQQKIGEIVIEKSVAIADDWVELVRPTVSSESDTEGHLVAGAKESLDLPIGWIQLTDPISGDPFYFNESTNVTTWEMPSLRLEQPLTQSLDHFKADEAKPEPEEILPIHESLVSGNESNKIELSLRLPQGWVDVIDPNSGLTYYFHEVKNITTWDRPSVGDEAQEDDSSALSPTAQSTPELSASRAQSADELPSGWVELVDPSTGQIYFFNEQENLSTWVRPDLVHSPTNPTRAEESIDRVPKSVASFSFCGKLCTLNKTSRDVVVFHNIDVVPLDDVAAVERAKREHGISGPLNSCAENLVMQYVEQRVRDKSDDLLWSLILIAAKSNGRLRSDDGVKDPTGPEAAIIDLLLREDGDMKFETNGGSLLGKNEGINGSQGSLQRVQSLLLRGRRELAVDEALANQCYAIALLVAIMCDRESYQRAVREFADHSLPLGSPLHTIALLLSSQLQPLAESALAGRDINSTIWGHDANELRRTWKYHLAAIISNRTPGWDKIVLTLGDRLLELGDVKEAHFCFMVCGAPLSSPMNPSSRMAIVGCDHLVPMDVALMTTEGIDAYERSEAYEWAKRLGNRNAAIPSLQPFKLIYASLLCDLGFSGAAERYLHNIRLCAGLDTSVPRGYVSPSPFALFSDRAAFSVALQAMEARLSVHVSTEAKPNDGGYHDRPTLGPLEVMKDRPSMNERTLSMSKVSNNGALPIVNDLPHEDEMTFVSAKSNLPDISTLSLFETKVASYTKEEEAVVIEKESNELEALVTEGKPIRKNEKEISGDKRTASTVTRSSRGTGVRSRKLKEISKANLGVTKPVSNKRETRNGSEAGSSGQARQRGHVDRNPEGKTSSERPLSPLKVREYANAGQSDLQSSQGPPDAVAGSPKTDTIDKPNNLPNEACVSPGSPPRNARKEPPVSAPAVMTASESKKPSKPPAAPSSEKKGRMWGLGIKATMTKWLNPDAKTADLGEGMQAYYDEKRKVWVFPGEDPDEKTKPLPPPPKTPGATAASGPSQSGTTPIASDPLAAMMAPPKRTPGNLPRGVVSRTSSSAPGPFMATSPAGVSVTPPQYALFQPKPGANYTPE